MGGGTGGSCFLVIFEIKSSTYIVESCCEVRRGTLVEVLVAMAGRATYDIYYSILCKIATFLLKISMDLGISF